MVAIIINVHLNIQEIIVAAVGIIDDRFVKGDRSLFWRVSDKITQKDALGDVPKGNTICLISVWDN